MENSKETAMEDIVRRLELVETRHVASLQEARALRKQNRRLRLMLLVPTILSGMFVLVFALAATKPAATQDVIRAKKLEIVDNKGTVRATLGASYLWLYDERGNIRAGITVFAEGPQLWLNNEKGLPRAGLSATGNVSELSLIDDRGHGHALLWVPADGPALLLLDKDGKVIWQAPPTKSGLPPVAPK